jgi:nucleotide-binding universal stress UspA family protein
VAGASVEEAVTSVGWDEGELLVVGADAAGAATRVLLGDPGATVLRTAPVPVVLTPGTTTL